MTLLVRRSGLCWHNLKQEEKLLNAIGWYLALRFCWYVWRCWSHLSHLKSWLPDCLIVLSSCPQESLRYAFESLKLDFKELCCHEPWQATACACPSIRSFLGLSWIEKVFLYGKMMNDSKNNYNLQTLKRHLTYTSHLHLTSLTYHCTNILLTCHLATSYSYTSQFSHISLQLHLIADFNTPRLESNFT